MNKKDIPDFLEKGQFKSIADAFEKLRGSISRDGLRVLWREWKEKKPITINDEREYRVERKDTRTKERLYNEALDRLDELEHANAAILKLEESIAPFTIEPKYGSDTSEATPVILASDWHVEERVDAKKVIELNNFNLDIAKFRAEEFFQNAVKLMKKEAQDVKITNVVVALLGDFISSNIHEELLENTELRPVEASIFAMNLFISGFEFLLKETPYTYTVPCLVGNHGRITKKIHISTEVGNSLEFFMYNVLKNYFKDEPRIKFIISEADQMFMNIYDYKVRFLHGHAIKGGGNGILGMYPSVLRAIYQWDATMRADLTCLGHFHQYTSAKNFVSNGSLIGYSPFGLFHKFIYERPTQSFFLLDKKRGRTVTMPIMFSK